VLGVQGLRLNKDSSVARQVVARHFADIVFSLQQHRLEAGSNPTLDNCNSWVLTRVYCYSLCPSVAPGFMESTLLRQVYVIGM
jgi:hypothetical protein